MAERLQEVAEQFAIRCANLLRDQAEVIGVAGELVEELLRTLELTAPVEARPEPERAGRIALLFGEPVRVQDLVVAVHEIDNAEIIDIVHARRAPMIPASAALGP